MRGNDEYVALKNARLDELLPSSAPRSTPASPRSRCRSFGDAGVIPITLP